MLVKVATVDLNWQKTIWYFRLKWWKSTNKVTYIENSLNFADTLKDGREIWYLRISSAILHQVVIRRSIKFTIDIEAWKTTCLNLQPISHYDDVIMGAIASQITSLTIVYSAVYSDADQSKHQSSASLAFVWGIHRGPVNSAHKWPITRKMFPFDDVIMMPANGRTNFIQIAIKIWYFFRKMHFEMLSAICRPFCSDCSMLIIRHCYIQLMDVAREI